MQDKIRAFQEQMAGIPMLQNAPMSQYTSFRIGGAADLMLSPRSPEEILRAVCAAKRAGLPYMIMGNGTNLLVSDEGIEGLVIRINGNLSTIQYEGNRICAYAGTPLAVLAKDTVEKGFSGLEWAAGIPGTLGGAIAMNAGAYEGEIKQTLKSVEYLENGALLSCVPKDGDMGYRTSAFCAPERIVVSGTLELIEDDGKARERMREFTLRRKEKQPLAYPSAGSAFRRPAGSYAGMLIEQAGLKGESVGGAQVSVLHAGFIINRGGATCQDVLTLIQRIIGRVYENSGIQLQPEIKYIGRGSEQCIF